MAGESRGLPQVRSSVAEVAAQPPSWVTWVRAANAGPMTLEGTNTWVLRAVAGAPALVVDPGPAEEPHLRAVAELGPFAGVLVTHGHPDHVDGLARFRELTGAPLLPAGQHAAAGVSVTTVETPGHTADSVCFVASVAAGSGEAGGTGNATAAQRAVFTGDTILGRGTTVVAWPDGDLADYLTSLRTLADYPAVPALPGHGPPLADCAAAADYYLRHRLARLDEVRRAVAAGARTPAEVASRVYADLDPSLQAAAEWSVRAQLGYLAAHERESLPDDWPLDAL